MTDWQPETRTLTGTVYAAEFLWAGDGDDRPPGTYLTIRLDGDPPISAGRVEIKYLPLQSAQGDES